MSLNESEQHDIVGLSNPNRVTELDARVAQSRVAWPPPRKATAKIRLLAGHIWP